MRVSLPNDWEPRDYQKAAWKYLHRGGRHAELIWHRRAGKDALCLHWAACAAFERRGNYWHCLPEYAQSRKAIWDAVNPHSGKRRVDEAFPPQLRKRTNEQEMFIEFVNGSTWQLIGSDRYDSLVGTTPAGIVYSEWALANPDVRAYMRPIIAENKGWQLFITTPRGRNHAYTTLRAAEKIMVSGGDAFAQVLTADETGVFSREQLQQELDAYIAEFGEDYGRSRFEQEYLCSFEAANMGAILARAIGMAEKQGRISDDVEFDEGGQPIFISADIGRRDTATWWFWQPQIGGYQVIDHDSGWGIDAEEWCQRLAARIAKYRLLGHRTALGRIWLPHDARAKTFAARRSALEIFAEYFGHDRVGITPASSIADRINAARVLMPRVRFNASRCERGLEALRAWQYEWNEDTKTFGKEPLHDWASHDGDGFSYGCVILREAEPPPPPPPPMRGLTVGGRSTATLEEMWAEAPRQDNRRL